MLTTYDWLRRSKSGKELLAALRYLKKTPDLPTTLGPPHSALASPCKRCWIYPRNPGRVYCTTCQAILDSARKMSRPVAVSVAIWGFLRQIPQSLRQRESEHAKDLYIHDDHHFFAVLGRWSLQPWLQDLVVRHGANLKGALQLFPLASPKFGQHLGNALCWAACHEAYLPPDRLYVRFYAAPSEMTAPHKRDRQGLLNFEVSEFLAMMEMAGVFRLLLHPDEQKELFQILTLQNAEEAQFSWGRFLGLLDLKARDMLNAWGIRNWPQNRIRLLRELMHYVYLDFSRSH